MAKDLKMVIVKELRTFGCFCEIHFTKIPRVTSDNIILGHIRFPGTSYNFWNTLITCFPTNIT